MVSFFEISYSISDELKLNKFINPFCYFFLIQESYLIFQNFDIAFFVLCFLFQKKMVFSYLFCKNKTFVFAEKIKKLKVIRNYCFQIKSFKPFNNQHTKVLSPSLPRNWQFIAVWELLITRNILKRGVYICKKIKDYLFDFEEILNFSKYINLGDYFSKNFKCNKEIRLFTFSNSLKNIYKYFEVYHA